MLRGSQYEWWNPYYAKHLSALSAASIIDEIAKAETTYPSKGEVLIPLVKGNYVLSLESDEIVFSNSCWNTFSYNDCANNLPFNNFLDRLINGKHSDISSDIYWWSLTILGWLFKTKRPIKTNFTVTARSVWIEAMDLKVWWQLYEGVKTINWNDRVFTFNNVVFSNIWTIEFIQYIFWDIRDVLTNEVLTNYTVTWELPFDSFAVSDSVLSLRNNYWTYSAINWNVLSTITFDVWTTTRQKVFDWLYSAYDSDVKITKLCMTWKESELNNWLTFYITMWWNTYRMDWVWNENCLNFDNHTIGMWNSNVIVIDAEVDAYNVENLGHYAVTLYWIDVIWHEIISTTTDVKGNTVNIEIAD